MKAFSYIENLVRGNKIFGIHLHVKSQGEYDFESLLVKRKFESISVVSQKGNEADEISSLKQLPPNSQISLCLSGSGVLVKKVDSVQLEDGLGTVLPNGNLDEFVVQQMELGNTGKALVAIIRKDFLQSIVDEFLDLKLWLVDIYLGPIVLKNLLPLFEENICLQLPEMELEISQGEWVSYVKKRNTNWDRYRIGDELIDSNCVLPFTCGISTLGFGETKHIPELLMQVRSESVSRRIGIGSQLAFLVLVFLILLGNFIRFEAVNEEYSQFSVQLQTGENLIYRMNNLKKEVERKESYYVKSGLDTQSKLSYYSDRIASLLPSDLRLSSLDLNPLQGKIKEGKEMHFANDFIQIDGETNHPVQFNNWIQKLRKEDWVEEISKQEYFKKDQNKAGEFRIEIKIKK